MGNPVELLASLVRRVTGRSRRRRRTRELDEELALHAELLERDFLASGMSAGEAHDASIQRLGNRTRIAERTWEALSLGPLDSFLRELRFATRTIGKSPGFALTVVITLALGIGATSTVFSVVDHVLLKPLNYPNSDRLVELFEHGAAGDRRLVSYPTLEDWAREGSGFAGMAYIRGNLLTLHLPDDSVRVVTAYVSPGFFRTIGSRPELGRTFAAEEEVPAGADAVVLSHDLWIDSFGGDPHVIGRTVTLDSSSSVVIGVMSPTFAVPSWAQLWRPLGRIVDRDPILKSRDFHADSRAIARLAPGVDVAGATRDLSRVQRRIAEAYPDAEAGWTGVELLPFRTAVVGDVSTALWALGAAVILILLIACVNVANLAAVRGASRGREIAVRLALGASRLQVTRQLLVEMLVLAGAGGCAGIVGAYAAVGWMRVHAPVDLPRASEVVVDTPVIALALVLIAMTAMFFGVVPAMRAGAPRGASNELLGGRSGYGGSRRERRSSTVLTGAQFALALALLVGAGLLVQSYRRLQTVELGFDPRNVLSLAVSSPTPADTNGKYALAFYDRLIDRLRAVPGVESAAAVNFLPLGRAGLPTQLRLPGRTPNSEDIATYLTVTEDYLRTMRIPLMRGRWFSADEMRTPSDGVVISEAVANRYWPGGDAVGKPVTIFRSSQERPNFGQAVPSVVIGVVANVRQEGPGGDPDPAVYVPMSAETWPWASLVVRAREISPNLRVALGSAVVEATPMSSGKVGHDRGKFDSLEQTLSSELAPRRYLLGLVGSFSVCALLLAAVGIFGVTSYAVARRTRELGIRLALGAAPREILATVLGRGMIPIVVGCASGLVATVYAARILTHLLYDTTSSDPTVLTVVPVLLAIVGFVACYFPARRAARVDPLIALRND